MASPKPRIPRRASSAKSGSKALLAKKSRGIHATHWIARIEAAVREFARGRPQFDDITCLALRR